MQADKVTEGLAKEARLLKRTAGTYTKAKLRKGFMNARISYRVLQVMQFTDADMKIIAKGLVIATTPEKAKSLLPKVAGHQYVTPLWQLKMVTLVGNYDACTLLYKGLDVAVFWKRQTSEVIPDACDPVPEGILENPDDVWVRFDLLYKSARQLTQAVSEDIHSLRTNLSMEEMKVSALQREMEAKDKTIASLNGLVKSLQGTAKRRIDNGKGQGSKVSKEAVKARTKGSSVRRTH